MPKQGDKGHVPTQHEYQKNYEEREYTRMKYQYGDFTAGETITALVMMGYSKDRAEVLVREWRGKHG